MRQLGSGSGKQLETINESILSSSGGSYQVNNIEDADPLYVGKVKTGGIWLIEKFVESTGEKTYANHSNNGSIADYTDAWTNRATLTYNRYNEITGV
jgi:hypothetical protein